MSDLAADANVDFTFTIQLTPAISGTYSGITFTNGEGTVTLKGGENKTIEGLPTTVTYKITETAVTGIPNTAKTGDEGTISTTLSEAEFTNTRETGDLTLSK